MTVSKTIGWLSATTLLTTTFLSSVLLNEVAAHHCGPFDFTGNCLHGGTESSAGSQCQSIGPICGGPARPIPTETAGNYRLSDGTIFLSNASDAYCTYISLEHMAQVSNTEVRSAAAYPPFRNDGPCPVSLPAGAYRLVDGTIMSSNGSAYCHYVSYEHYEKKDRRPITHLEGEIPLHGMDNHFACAQ